MCMCVCGAVLMGLKAAFCKGREALLKGSKGAKWAQRIQECALAAPKEIQLGLGISTGKALKTRGKSSRCLGLGRQL